MFEPVWPMHGPWQMIPCSIVPCLSAVAVGEHVHTLPYTTIEMIEI